MKLHCYIDDTSVSGNTEPFDFVSDVRKQYIGYIADNLMLTKIKKELERLKSKYINVLNIFPKREFHFVEIYNSNMIAKDKKLDIFRDFSDLIVNNNVKIFSQSIRKDNHFNAFVENKPLQIDDIAMLVLFFKQIKDYLNNNMYEKVEVVIDNGIDSKIKKILEIPINHFKEISKQTTIKFVDSDKNLFVQLADFCAYSYTRQQYLASALLKQQDAKEQLDEFKFEMYNNMTKVTKQFVNINFLDGTSTEEVKNKGAYIKWLASNQD